ncbi:hypothetical protein RA267_27855, partial [Pseudomonas syringae pv. tagetis]|uniref:hypothetical protein n=1 Tax=Pseudomonas syringae group genomosp. 7 TaxID=251699 RepID=UPI00376FFA81
SGDCGERVAAQGRDCGPAGAMAGAGVGGGRCWVIGDPVALVVGGGGGVAGGYARRGGRAVGWVWWGVLVGFGWLFLVLCVVCCFGRGLCSFGGGLCFLICVVVLWFGWFGLVWVCCVVWVVWGVGVVVVGGVCACGVWAGWVEAGVG